MGMIAAPDEIDGPGSQVGSVHNDSPTMVCYCFGHTAEAIRDEILRTGRSTIEESIRAEIKAGHCRCETMNPKGKCCLGDVIAIVKSVTAAK